MNDQAAQTGQDVASLVEARRAKSKSETPPYIAANAEPAEALDAITNLLALPHVGVRATGAVVHGEGARASADVALSNGAVLTIDSVEDMKPATLARRVAMVTGARPALGGAEMLALASYLRRAGEHVRTVTEDDTARDLGVEYLRRAQMLPVAMSDRAQRWQAFTELTAHDPWRSYHARGAHLIDGQVVLLDADTGARFIRTGWFTAVARQHDPRAGNDAAILARMLRVGWERRATSGRIKASHPEDPTRALGWAFVIASGGWEATVEEAE